MDGRFIVAIGMLLTTGGARAQDVISLYYNERPPYLMTEADGTVSGLTGSPAARAFKAAGVAFTWVKLPTNRQLVLIRDNLGLDCAVGWFKNPERESFAKYTRPIYRDQPTVALVNRALRIRPGTRLETLLATRRVRVLVKEGYSYGPFIDGLLARYKPELVTTAAENVQMLQMVSGNRADLMFAAGEEADYFIEQAGLTRRDIWLGAFPDMPNGEQRYIMCSRQVPDEVMTRLNQVIPDVNAMPPVRHPLPVRHP